MARSVKYRYIVAKMAMLKKKMKKSAAALKVLTKKGYTDTAMLADLNECKCKLAQYIEELDNERILNATAIKD